MPNYTLHYFNGRGRAEIIRMMFGVAGVKYMDKRYEFTDWDRCRNDFPCMWLPCLEMDGGMRMPETMSICRHLAREFNFYPKSNMDMFRCDYICDCFYEIMDDYMRYYHYKNGRFRYNYMENSMMGSNMSSGMGSNMSSGMGSNMSSGMGSNMSSGMGMGSNMSSGMGNMSSGMGNMSSGMGNMSSGMGNMSSGMGNMSSGMGMGSNMSSGMGMGSNMSSGMEMGSNMSSGMGMGSNMSSGSGMGGDYEKYMYWRYMNTFNRCMPFMERTLGMRNSGSQFFMGEQMMWCDMMMYCCMENMYMENQSMFSNYPKMMGLYNRVAGHTKVSAYLKGRRSTPW